MNIKALLELQKIEYLKLLTENNHSTEEIVYFQTGANFVMDSAVELIKLYCEEYANEILSKGFHCQPDDFNKFITRSLKEYEL